MNSSLKAPYTIRLAAPAYRLLERVLPERVTACLDRLSRGQETIVQQDLMRQLLKKVGMAVTIQCVVIAFLLFVYQEFAVGWIHGWLMAVLPARFEWVARLGELMLLLAVLARFIYLMVASHAHCPEAERLRQDGEYRRVTLAALSAVRLVLAMALVLYCIGIYFNLTLGLAVAAAVAVVVAIMNSRSLRRESSDIERRFMDNLAAREREAESKRSVGREVEAAFRTYDLHLADFDIDPQSSFCGCRLMNLDLRRSCGVNVVQIVRGGVCINAPGGRECLYPGDRVVVAGSDEQIRQFGDALEASVAGGKGNKPEARTPTFSLERLKVLPEMPFCGQTLAESRIGERAQCVVLGIVRDGGTTMTPTAASLLEAGDTLVLAGETEKIKSLLPAGAGS